MKNKPRLLLLLAILAVIAAVVLWVVSRRSRLNPVEQLVVDMVQIPGADFLMGKYEVTQAQWASVMGENPSIFKGADHPVENVSWDDCQAFLERLNALPVARASGLVFRLPTAAEWETACRAGSTNDYCRLANGTEITWETLNRVAWFGEGAFQRQSIALQNILRLVGVHSPLEESTHHPVGRKSPNAYGLHDMLGNVCEWTDTADGENRVSRGGAWMLTSDSCMSSSQQLRLPSERYSILGFRICASHAEDGSHAEQGSHAEFAESAERESCQ